MITYKGGENNLYMKDSERKYWEDSDCKILIFNWERWCFHETDWCLFPNNNTLKVNVGELIEEIKKYDICFFFITEMIDQTVDGEDKGHLPTILTLFEEMSKLNVVYFCLSEDSNFPIDESKSLNMPWFADKNIYISQNTTSDFDYKSKGVTFNMLLGSEREHRTKMFELLRHNSPFVYLSYMGHAYHIKNSHTYLDDGDIIMNLSTQDLSEKLNTMKKLGRENSDYCISHIVPERIYNNTHFDIVAESQPLKSRHNFTTEKTGKPIAAGRFFIWYNSPHKVEYLRKFGFEFQDYLCEYDNIIDNDKRLEAVMELIKEIGDNENYIKKIYKDTKDARIHNQEIYNKLKETHRSRFVDWMTGEVNRTL